MVFSKRSLEKGYHNSGLAVKLALEVCWDAMTTIVIATCIFVLIGLFLAGMILFAKARLVVSELCRITINGEEGLTLEVEGGGRCWASSHRIISLFPLPVGEKRLANSAR